MTTTLDATYLRKTVSTRYTNLGPGFQIDVGGNTTLTVHRRGPKATVNGKATRLPSIDWVNTWGNTYRNNNHYRFDAGAVIAATALLDQIEANHNTRKVN